MLELDELEESELGASGGASMFFPQTEVPVEKNVLFSLLFLNEDNYNFYRSREDFRFFLSYK